VQVQDGHGGDDDQPPWVVDLMSRPIAIYRTTRGRKLQEPWLSDPNITMTMLQHALFLSSPLSESRWNFYRQPLSRNSPVEHHRARKSDSYPGSGSPSPKLNTPVYYQTQEHTISSSRRLFDFPAGCRSSVERNELRHNKRMQKKLNQK